MLHNFILPPCDIAWLGLEPNLVSIVLPVYNQAALLSSAIKSILSQSYNNFELIIVNDGSKDAIEKVVAEFINHPKITFYSQPNKGLPKTLSSGFQFARGEYWTWTSADNLMGQEQLSKQVEKLQANPQLGMVYADYVAIDDCGNPLADPNWRSHNRPDGTHHIHLPKNTNYLNLRMDNFIGPCFMYRGWIGKLLGPYAFISGIEDYDYWMRINRLFSIEHLGIDEPLYQYRVHDNSLSAQAATHKIFQKACMLMHLETIRAKYFEEPFKFICDRQVAQRGFFYENDIIYYCNDQNITYEAKKNIFIFCSDSPELFHYFSSNVHIFTPTVIIFTENTNATTFNQLKYYVSQMEFVVSWAFSDKAFQTAKSIGISIIFDGNSEQCKYITEIYFNNRIFCQTTTNVQIIDEIEPRIVCHISDIKRFSKIKKKSINIMNNIEKKIFPLNSQRRVFAKSVWQIIKKIRHNISI